MKCVRNATILCGTNNLHLDAPEDIADGIIEIGSTFKRFYTNVNVFISGILPRDCYWSTNRVNIKDVKEIFKLHRLGSGQWFPKSRTFLFSQNSSGRKGLFKIYNKSKSIHKSIEDFYDTGNINRY